MTGSDLPVHGGPDALGVPAHDLSTNANACGPYPPAVRALQAADARHYPDPTYTALTVQLAAWHGVAPSRIVLAASASEFIQRISVAAALERSGAGPGRGDPPAVWLPQHAYGDYARAAHAAGLLRADDAAHATLLWACDPSSPLGQPQAGLADVVAALAPGQTLVLDQAYDPLRLQGALALDAAAQDRVWRLLTPNKALGLTGVRAAYAIAPAISPCAAEEARALSLLARVRALAPSWTLGAHGVALLQTWATLDAADWLAASRRTLRDWKQRQMDLLRARGWRVESSVANFLVADIPLVASAGGHFYSDSSIHLAPLLAALRSHGFKLRDCASFGLLGKVRMAVVAPKVQDGLARALEVFR